jgi:hypothetical protein
MKCLNCGKKFVPATRNTRYCGNICKLAVKQAERRKRQSENVKAEWGEVVEYTPKPRKLIETDEEQRAIRDRVNSKLNIPPGPIKHYTPDSPEFDRIARQCTDPKKIRNTPWTVGNQKWMDQL